jgi:UDP-N-acetylglucosamine 1-carboxyvinyltransferase
MTRRVFEKFGVDLILSPNHLHLDCRKGLKIEPDFGNAVPIISDGPWPQFPSDMMSCMIVAATQAQGTVLFFEKMFESRIYFVDRLIGMGANAIVCDPHRVVISGPARLRGSEVVSPDIRAGMAMVIAGCCAEGQTIVNRAEMVYRGYENLSEKLSNLGVNIKAVD